MPLETQTAEEATKLLAQRDSKVEELETLKTTSIETMWLSELEILRTAYIARLNTTQPTATPASKPKKAKRKLKVAS